MDARASSESVVFEIAPIPHSVAEARERVVEVAAGRLSPTAQAELRMVAAEVIANAVRHGGTREDVRVETKLLADYLCVKVTDAGPGIAPRPRATAPTEDGGFGLVVVEKLTRRWGITREDSHTRTWFEFDLDR